MSNLDELIKRFREDIEAYFEEERMEFAPGDTPVRLSEPTFGADEVVEAIESLLSTWVTMGKKVECFEEQWADYVGTDHAVMVNSGSSANLLALEALRGSRIQEGDEVIVPAVSWSTSLFPILDVETTPVLVDVDEDTYTIDVDAFEAAVTDDTAAVVLVHLLGNPCERDRILEICEEHDRAVVEDCCEAHGASYAGRKVGSFGEMGTFSFFFSHHISTIEGGMIVTNSDKHARRLKMSRAHGWIREIEEEHKERFRNEHSDIDERFLFATHGYNLRPTEIQGAFGIHQLRKLDEFVSIRHETASYLNDRLVDHVDYLRLLEERDGTMCSWFAYPLVVRERAPFDRDDLQEHLEECRIETRPILAGNLARQPAMDEIDHRVVGNLDVANEIHDNGLFIGNHHMIDVDVRRYIGDCIEEFIQRSV
jgi:CDP-6-deoxy-D-xylo-4-hexulose-3-dehydrase